MAKYSVTGEADSFWRECCVLRESIERVARDRRMEGGRLKRGTNGAGEHFPSANKTLHISLKDKVLS